MTDRTAQCGRTFVHPPHETVAGPCPGLAPLDPPLIDRRDVDGPRPGDPTYVGRRRKTGPAPLLIGLTSPPTVLNPEVLGSRPVAFLPDGMTYREFVADPEGHLGEPPPPGLMEDLAAGASDPLTAWMASYPGENTEGPGWGDDEDVEAGRCCPTCRSALTEHNGLVRDAGYAAGQRDTLEALQRAVTDPVKPLSRVGVTVPPDPDPWAESPRRLCGARPAPARLRIPTGCDLPPEHAGDDHHAAWDTGLGWVTVTWRD